MAGRLPAFLLLCLGVLLYATDSLLVATTMPAAAQEIGGLGLNRRPALPARLNRGLYAEAPSGIGFRRSGLDPGFFSVADPHFDGQFHMNLGHSLGVVFGSHDQCEAEQ